MNRRQFLTRTGSIATVGMAGIAGCSSTEEAPPRKSNIIKSIEVSSNSTLVVDPVSTSDQWVMSRRELQVENTINAELNAVSTSFSTLSPVGVASAKGRGAGGRGSKSGGSGFSSAPKTSRGRARYGGGSYVPVWYNDHDDEVERYPVDINDVGVKYFGSPEEFREQAPSPGPVAWDEVFTSPDGEMTISADEVGLGQELQEGWYRIGSQVITPDGETNMGWESYDFKVEQEDEVKITKIWKVSPRI
jgi:hypothetical protein